MSYMKQYVSSLKLTDCLLEFYKIAFRILQIFVCLSSNMQVYISFKIQSNLTLKNTVEYFIYETIC